MLNVQIILSFVLLFGPLLQAQRQQQQLKYFMQKAGLQRKVFSPRNARNGQLDYTNLDDFRDVFSDYRKLLMQYYIANKKAILKFHRQRGTLQSRIPKSEPFPCALNETRSVVVPTSAHRLRPGDIDIIGAMGDSFTAGTAILAESLWQEPAEFRGIAASGGGLKDWRTYLTLPNILKVFNPQLYGYAIDNTLAHERGARFNLAEPYALTRDMPFQAHVLVRRLQADPKVDMLNHWKLISIFAGVNDICTDMCYYDRLEDFIESHRKALYNTLEILKVHVPRLLVNILPVVNLPESFAIMRNVPPLCYWAQRIACNCVIGRKWSSADIKNITRTIRLMQQIDREVANLPEFQTDTFTVTYQPFTTNLTLVNTQNNHIKLNYFTPDCFHFSQLGHAAAANMLWNNMLQPDDQKEQLIRDPFVQFECPTNERPYIATLGNSKN